MGISFMRQIRDIQVQGERLISEKQGIEEFEYFQKYSDELKELIAREIKDEFIHGLLGEIPSVFDKSNGSDSQKNRNIIGTLIGIFTPGMSKYYGEQSKIALAKENVRTICGKYSSIEFILKRDN